MDSFFISRLMDKISSSSYAYYANYYPKHIQQRISRIPL